MLIVASFALFALWTFPAVANVEKLIFTSPEPANHPIPEHDLPRLYIERLTPASLTLRRTLSASFPTHALPLGSESWYLLDGLKANQRHELRICWPATQPTDFTINTHTLDSLLDNQHLIQSLTNYSSAVQKAGRTSGPTPISSSPPTSHLFVQLLTKAAYFSSNRTLMQNVPDVTVDIILDPYHFNLIPHTLLPTLLYLTLITAFAIPLSRIIATTLPNLLDFPKASRHQE